MSKEITNQQALRYSRQINLASIDIEGKEKLLNSRRFTLYKSKIKAPSTTIHRFVVLTV